MSGVGIGICAISESSNGLCHSYYFDISRSSRRGIRLWIILAFIARMIDPLADRVGQHILEAHALRPVFGAMYNMPIVPLTRFNDSVVMGSFLIALIAMVPSFFLFRYAIRCYRVTVVARLKNTRWWKLMQSTAFYKWYVKYEDLYG